METMTTNYLGRIEGHRDLIKLNISQMQALTREIRQYILKVVSQNGGHLASNLGVVELSVALEYVFDTSVDRLIWDVGHQSYTHKILTGRRDEFDSLRQFRGLSGFPKRVESACDPYDTGHSSTSIAAAVGFAKARDLKGEKHKVIAVIGDGSMTGGEAYEALNLAGGASSDILVILNDNRMSIAPNIGGMSNYLNRIRTSRAYQMSKFNVRSFLARVPVVGRPMINGIEAIKESLKYFMVNGLVFRELGFNYYGPVDGHNLENLIEILKQVKEIRGPVLLHVLTEKGRGYTPAEDDAAMFHGIAPFDLSTGKTNPSASRVPTYTQAFSQKLLELAEKDERIIAITAAMPDGTGLEEFRQVYPKRFIDVGIAEQTAVTVGTALALEGLRPVVAVYSSFMQRAFDQLIQDAAIQKAPLVFALDRSGIVGEDGPTHHGAFDLSYLSQIPNMTVMVPRDERMLKEMLEAAVLYEEGPVALRYPRGRGVGRLNYLVKENLCWGKGQLLRPGQDVMILAAGPLVYQALTAAAYLEKEGWSAGVWDPCFIKPLDAKGILELAKSCRTILTVEENVAAGGFGSRVAALLAEQKPPVPRLACLSLPDTFVEQGSQQQLLQELGLDAQGICRACQSLLRQTTPGFPEKGSGKRNGRISDDGEGK